MSCFQTSTQFSHNRIDPVKFDGHISEETKHIESLNSQLAVTS